ncbi:MAG: 4Fe-4S binding protein [Dehalobacter sp. 4CP]|uniref:4Fe-4S binding protein n=1 Tax=Dehalobacter sp. CP TaxID=2594474 RepID=UPI0013C8A53D|nr:4Fe-4S binding protein [Dehalobacter sp. 4CP]
MKYLDNIIRILFLGLFLYLLANGKIMLWLALFAISLIASLVFGMVYCGYVCPMNTLMNPVAWLSKKLNFQTTRTPKWLKNGYFAWVAVIVSIAAMLLSNRILNINLPILPIWLVISVLVTLRYKPAVFHNLVCPFGALQRLFGRYARLSAKINNDSCIRCRLCEKACPAGAITISEENRKAFINTALCHQCTKCRQVCFKGAIRYTNTKESSGL